jgi:hypothetical protein
VHRSLASSTLFSLLGGFRAVAPWIPMVTAFGWRGAGSLRVGGLEGDATECCSLRAHLGVRF